MIDAGAESNGATNTQLPTEDARSLAGVPDGVGPFRTPDRLAAKPGAGQPPPAPALAMPRVAAPGARCARPERL